MGKNTGFYKMMAAAEAMERTVWDDDFMQYDSTTAYSTENYDITGDDWTAVQDIFGANGDAMERYAEGMIDWNLWN